FSRFDAIVHFIPRKTFTPSHLCAFAVTFLLPAFIVPTFRLRQPSSPPFHWQSLPFPWPCGWAQPDTEERATRGKPGTQNHGRTNPCMVGPPWLSIIVLSLSCLSGEACAPFQRFTFGSYSLRARAASPTQAGNAPVSSKSPDAR